VQTSVMYNRNWWEHSAQRSLAHLLQTNSSGMGSASGMPWQRVCIHTPHTSHATMRSPSSTRVPHLQLTTQSSNPPATQQTSVSFSSCSGSSDSCNKKKECLSGPAYVCQAQAHHAAELPYATGALCRKCTMHAKVL